MKKDDNRKSNKKLSRSEDFRRRMEENDRDSIGDEAKSAKSAAKSAARAVSRSSDRTGSSPADRTASGASGKSSGSDWIFTKDGYSPGGNGFSSMPGDRASEAAQRGFAEEISSSWSDAKDKYSNIAQTSWDRISFEPVFESSIQASLQNERNESSAHSKSSSTPASGTKPENSPKPQRYTYTSPEHAKKASAVSGFTATGRSGFGAAEARDTGRPGFDAADTRDTGRRQSRSEAGVSGMYPGKGSSASGDNGSGSGNGGGGRPGREKTDRRSQSRKSGEQKSGSHRKNTGKGGFAHGIKARFKEIFAGTFTDLKAIFTGKGGIKGSGKGAPAYSTPAGRILRRIGYAGITCLLICFIAVGSVIVTCAEIRPDQICSDLEESTVIYDMDGKSAYNVYANDQNREVIEYKNIPEDLINAVVAIEDKTFWKHHGFNFIRMGGAILESLAGGGDISGTSTITQQLARNVYLEDTMTTHSYTRKLKEAYYTMVIEARMSKEEIMEAYLNTINLGFGAAGVQVAAQAYFSKDASDLDLLECASLAALPKSPSSYALILRGVKGAIDESDENFMSEDGQYTYIYNGDISEGRRKQALLNMLDQGMISQKEYDKTVKKNLRKHMDPNYSATGGLGSYFSDYVIEEVIADLQEKANMSEDEAKDYVYNRSINIYSTLDMDSQETIEEEFHDSYNFPSTIVSHQDSQGNIVNVSGAIVMYDYDNILDGKGAFTFNGDEFEWTEEGDLVIKRGHRLNIYTTTYGGTTDYSLEFKYMYTVRNGIMYTIEGGTISIPAEYKSLDNDGNCVISSQYFTDYPGVFDTKDGLKLLRINSETSEANYTLRDEVEQPQAAMVIIENETGQIRAMVGGRSTSGRMLYNRATATRQPGSSIKPLSVYSAALQKSYESEKAGNDRMTFSYPYDDSTNHFYGKFLTAGSIIVDEEMTVEGRKWPSNYNGKFSGPMTMREAITDSVNTCAVKIYSEVGADYAYDQLKKFGITSVVDSGEVNDMNAAAMALGGMTNGVSALEMASAYSTFANEGVHKSYSCYTKVTDKEGNVLLEAEEPEETKVLDKGVAWIMLTMLQSVVSNGSGTTAAISSCSVAGKTGTTSDSYDIWFCGLTPKYSAAIWMGNDVNLEMEGSSVAAATLWGTIMEKITADEDQGSFFSRPSNVITYGGEYYTAGTESSVSAKIKAKVKVCAESGELMTPWCTSSDEVSVSFKYIANMTEEEKEAALKKNGPKYYCHIHNKNKDKYPINPKYDTEDEDEDKDKDKDKDAKTDKSDDTSSDDSTDSSNKKKKDDDDIEIEDESFGPEDDAGN